MIGGALLWLRKWRAGGRAFLRAWIAMHLHMLVDRSFGPRRPKLPTLKVTFTIPDDDDERVPTLLPGDWMNYHGTVGRGGQLDLTFEANRIMVCEPGDRVTVEGQVTATVQHFKRNMPATTEGGQDGAVQTG